MPDMIMETSEKIRQRILETATPQVKLVGLDLQETLASMTSAKRRQLLRMLQEAMDAASGDNADTHVDVA